MLEKFMKYYFPVALILLGLYFFCKSFCHSSEPIPTAYEFYFEHFECRTKYIDNRKKSTAEQRQRWQEEYEFHMFHAIRTYNDAKDKCWWLPNISQRDQARMCWTTAIASVAAPTPQLKIIVSVTNLLTQYGLDCIDEWYYIQDKLTWSEFHFLQCENFQNLIQNR